MNPRLTDLHTTPENSWCVIGQPTPGTVTALAFSPNATLFVGTRPGLYRTNALGKGTEAHWQKLPAAPLEILSLGISPQFATDATLLAGTGHGLFLSHDGGDHWQTTQTPMPDPVVLCLAFSPNYAADGIIVAGTLEDGLYFSDSRGERWSSRSVGMLDAAVYSLAISPDFARDETVFAGTESALYYSYNGARAWKLLDFPEEAAPILSLALSPHFADDQTIYVGTEKCGLYCSVDLGKTWQKVDLPASCINALAFAPDDGSLIAATDSGLYRADSDGELWHCLLDQPDAFSLAIHDDLIVAGLVANGAWLSRNRSNWQPFFTLSARLLTGMAISPRFDADPLAFLYGPQEGIWRTLDGGRSWLCLNENLPSLAIQMMALSPQFAQDRTVLAASAEGLLISDDAGDRWSLMAEMPAVVISFAPGGGWVTVASPEGDIWLTKDLATSWQRIFVPWGKQSVVLALAIDDRGWLRVALLNQARTLLSIWEGEAGHLVQIWAQPVRPAPVVCLWVPRQAAANDAWYVSLDQQVWEFQRSPVKGAVSANCIFATTDGSKVLSLAGDPGGSALFACTGQFIHQVIGTDAPSVVHDFGDERAVALALSSNYPQDPRAFALLLGGLFVTGF